MSDLTQYIDLIIFEKSGPGVRCFTENRIEDVLDLDCGCRMECDQVHYESSVSTTAFPADIYIEDAHQFNHFLTEETLRYYN